MIPTTGQLRFDAPSSIELNRGAEEGAVAVLEPRGSAGGAGRRGRWYHAHALKWHFGQRQLASPDTSQCRDGRRTERGAFSCQRRQTEG